MNVYSSPNLSMVGHFKNVLETHEIACYISGESRGGAVGDLPPIECWPELRVVDESQIEEAKRIIEEALESTGQDAAPWNCPNCDETLEGQFTLCWKCGANRPDNA